jgi:hypothetical protein
MKTEWQDQVIEWFVAHLAANGYPDLAIDSQPDKEEHAKGKKTEQAIDAIAGKFAIEHTSIDTLPCQREADAIFAKCIGRLEEEIQLPFNLTIYLQASALRKGLNYTGVQAALRNWIDANASSLAWGRHEIEGTSSLPIGLIIFKRDGLDHKLIFARYIGSDDTLGQRMRQLIERKTQKLAPCSNRTRLLLIESSDIALMSHLVFWEALREAFPENLPDGVDEIWYADTSGAQSNRLPRFLRMTNDVGVLSERELP